jgi:hypothetical protein
VRKPDGTPGGDLCLDDPGREATTWYRKRFIMLCPATFDQDGRTLASLISGQAQIASGTLLDNLVTSGGIFLHEMMHWIGPESKYISRIHKIVFHHADYF